VKSQSGLVLVPDERLDVLSNLSKSLKVGRSLFILLPV
jgi:hypothetical protein